MIYLINFHFKTRYIMKLSGLFWFSNYFPKNDWINVQRLVLNYTSSTWIKHPYLWDSRNSLILRVSHLHHMYNNDECDIHMDLDIDMCTTTKPLFVDSLYIESTRSHLNLMCLAITKQKKTMLLKTTLLYIHIHRFTFLKF